MIWRQQRLTLAPRPRGVHLVTREVAAVVAAWPAVRLGLLHVFLQHTSASLALNENASPDVRRDLDAYLDRIAPEAPGRYAHADEGPDDMPAHLKACLLGSGLLLPVRASALALGTWQGLYLCEHRNHGGPRTLLLTLFGEPA